MNPVLIIYHDLDTAIRISNIPCPVSVSPGCFCLDLSSFPSHSEWIHSLRFCMCASVLLSCKDTISSHGFVCHLQGEDFQICYLWLPG